MRIILLALFVLAPLASARADDSARVYVFAKLGTAARSWTSISLDGEVIAKLKRGTFFAVDVAPGRHVLHLTSGGIPAPVEIRSGENSFVSLGWRREPDARAIPALRVVHAAHAHREMLNLRYIDVDKALSRSALKADPRAGPSLKRRAAPADPTP